MLSSYENSVVASNSYSEHDRNSKIRLRNFLFLSFVFAMQLSAMDKHEEINMDKIKKEGIIDAVTNPPSDACGHDKQMAYVARILVANECSGFCANEKKM